MAERYGAYGLGLAPLPGALPDVPASWPRLQLESSARRTAPVRVRIDETRAELPLVGGGGVVVHREPLQAVFVGRPLPTDEELVHPYLAPLAAVHARWRGWQTFHAGAFLHGGAVWGVVGGRTAGKSTLLAGLAARGVPIVADDLLVLDDEATLAGPRAIDLRGDAGERFVEADDLGTVGRRARHRLRLPTIVPLLPPVAGWVHLEWADDVEVCALSARERIERLDAAIAVTGSVAPGDLIDLATRPAVLLARPRRWERAGNALDALLEAVER